MIGDRIIAFLKENGPTHMPAICEALGLDYMVVTPALTACRRRDLIRIAGVAEAFGFTDVKSNAPVYEAIDATPAAEGPCWKSRPAVGSNTGVSARIREQLAQGAATAEELAQRIGEPVERVRSMVRQLANQTGGVVAVAGTRPIQYALYVNVKPHRPEKRERTRAGSGVIAGPILIKGYRWGSGWRV